MTARAVPADLPLSPATLDRGLAIMVALGLLLVFVSPTRLYYIPYEIPSDYWIVPPNFIDLIWLSIAAALFLRNGSIAPWPLLGAAVLVMISLTVIIFSTEPLPEKYVDLLMFNLRLLGGLWIGWLMVRAGLSANYFGSLLVAGAVIIAASLILAMQAGGYSDYYAETGRFVGIGLPPNEAAVIVAAASNALPLLFPNRRWLAFAAPVLFAGIVITGSRTGVILGLLSFVFWVPAILKSYRGSRAIFAWIVFAGAATLEIWVLTQLFGDLFTGQLTTAAERLGTTTDESTAGRILIYTALPLYLWQHLSVLVFGAGGSNVAVEWLMRNVAGVETFHAHSLLLQFVCAYGLFGIVLLGFIVRPLLRRGSRYGGDDGRAIRWFVLTILVGETVQYGLTVEKFLLLFAIPAGFAAALSSRTWRGTTA